MSVNLVMIGERIKKRRRQQGISQIQLAEIAGLEPSYISVIESGKKQLRLDTFVAIANALNTTVDDLLEGNQISDMNSFSKEIYGILSDCTLYERKVLTDIIVAVKDIMKKNAYINDTDT